MRKKEESRMVNDKLSEILSLADFVKFAKVRPLSDENETAFQRAVQYVEGTKPAPEPEEKPEDGEKPANSDPKSPKDTKMAKAPADSATDKKEEDKI